MCTSVKQFVGMYRHGSAVVPCAEVCYPQCNVLINHICNSIKSDGGQLACLGKDNEETQPDTKRTEQNQKESMCRTADTWLANMHVVDYTEKYSACSM